MHQQTQALVTRVDSGAISYLTLNRPTAGNSLSLDTIDALHRHLIDLRAERSISVIVLAGTGSRIFCAGHDLREFLDDGGTPEFSKEVVARCGSSSFPMELDFTPTASLGAGATLASCVVAK